MKDNLLISFSGGRTSAYMAQLLLKNYYEKYNMIVVFANTGKEREETLEFVDLCDKYFNLNCVYVEAVINPIKGKGIRHKVVNFETASRNGEPFEQLIKKSGIPNVKFPHCTRDLKAGAIHSYVRNELGWKNYKTAIGIRVDEIDRVSDNKDYYYPLITHQNGVRKSDINKYWVNMPFDLKLNGYEGNCDLCFKKSFRKLFTIINEHPELTKWYEYIELKYGKENSHFFRNNTSIFQLIESAKQPFIKATDDSKFVPEYIQGNLFDLDISNGCTESCEVF